jgi:hypothetical protein
MTFNLKYAGNYEMSVDLIHGPEMGSYTAKLDGQILGLLAEMNTNNRDKRPYSWGVRKLDAGEHKLTFDYQGPLGKGTSIGVDGLYLRPLEYHND